MKDLRGAFLLAGAILVACRNAPNEKRETSGTPPSERTPPSASAQAIVKTEPTEVVSESDRGAVEKFSNAWLSAQNERSLGDYERFYAAKFTGVKRSGPRRRSMDRTAWLADRKSMFEKPFTVSAKDTKVVSAGNLIALTFEQTWRSANYRDTGKKLLLLERTKDGFSIVREEMLFSEIESAPAAFEMTFERGTLGVWAHEHFALLTPEVVKLEWLEGHPEYVEETLARREVANRALPRPLLDKLAVEYEIFEASGKSCRVKALRYDVFARVEPHFGMRGEWEDAAAASEGRAPKKVAFAARALDLWSLAMNHPTGTGLKLGLVLEKTAECSKAIWGRKVVEGAPEPWKRRVIEGEEARKYFELLGARKELRAATRLAQHEGSVGRGASWSDGKGSLFSFSGPARKEVRVAELFGTGGCAYSTPTSLTFVDERSGKDFVALAPGSEIDERIESLVDFDGDGIAELLTKEAIYRVTRDGLEILLDLSVPSYECPC